MANEVEIVVKATSSGLKGEIKAAVDGATAGLSIDIVVKPQTATLAAEVRAAVTEATTGENIAVPVKAETTGLRQEVSTAATEAGSGQQVNVTVKAESTGLRSEVTAAKDVAGAGQSIDIPVHVDENLARSAGARAGAAAAQAAASEFSKLDLGSSFAAAVSVAVIPAIQSIGQLSGALGLIPAMATGAATAFGAVAIGVQGMDTALKASEKSIKANEAASKADQAAATANAAALNTSTSATTNHIAALKQHGAEITALIAKLNAQKLAGQNVTSELAAAKLAQANNTAELKAAQAAYTGNSSAIGANASAQKTAQQATTAAAAAHKAAAKAADEQAAAMKDLAPAAQAVVSQLIQLKPAWDDLHKSVQQALFQGLATQLKELANTVLPVVKTGLTQMATALNGIVTEITTFMSKASSLRDWKQIFTDLATTAHNFAGAIQPILQIFTDLTAVGASMLPGLAKGFADAMQKAADFVSKARETGQLREWIQTGIDACKTLWGIFSDLVQIIAKVTAAPGPGLLDMIKGILDVVLQLITQFPILIPLVEGFIAAWAIAKLVQGITGMIATIKSLGTAIELATTKVKAFGTASTVAGVESEAAATKAGVAWKALGLLVAGAVAASVADSILPQAKAGDNSPMAKMRDELHQLAEAIKDPKKALDDLQNEFAHFGDNFPNFANSPFVQGFKDAWNGIKTATTAGSSQVKAEAQKIQDAIRNAFTPIPAIATGAMGGLNVVVNEGIHNITAAIGTLPAQTQAQLGQLTPAMRGPAQAAMAGMLPIITSGIQNITNQVQGLTPQVQTALAPLSPGMQQSVQSAMGGLLPIVNTGIQNITTAVGQAPPQAGAALTPLQAALQTPTNSAFANMLQVVNTGAQSITTRTGQIPGDVTNSVSGMDGALKPAGQSAMQGFYQSMLDFYNTTIAPWLAGIAASIANLKGPASKDYYILHEAGTAIMAGLHDSMQSRWAPIAEWLRGLGGQISGAVGGSTGGVGSPITPPDLGVGAASGLSGPMAPYMIRPNYDFGSLYNTLNPPPLPSPGGGGSGGHHGGHGHHGGGGFDLDKLADALKGALHDVFSGGIKTDVDYNSLTLRLNQVTRSNARR